MNLAPLNRALPQGYSAAFKASDDPSVEDDEIAVRLMGIETPWSIQCGCGYFVLNEAGYENGEFAWMRQHGQSRPLAGVVNLLLNQLEATK